MNSLQTQYGYDAVFVSETPEYIQCTVCHLVLRDPIQILNCGHRFCSPCFARLKEYSTQMRNELRCPVDRNVVDLDKVCADPGLRRAVSYLSVKCNNWQQGCSWQGELSDLEHHDRRCEHRPSSDINSFSTHDLNDLAAKVSILQGRMDSYELELDKKEKENTYLKHSFLELKKQCRSESKDLAEKIVSIEIDLESTKKCNSSLEKMNAELKVEVDSCKKNNVALEIEINLLKEKNNLLEKEVKRKQTIYPEKSSKPEESKIKLETRKDIAWEPAFADARQVKRKTMFTHFKCTLDDVTILPDDIINFNTDRHSTLVASDAGVPPGSKAFYEVTILKCGEAGGCRVGWVDNNFFSSEQSGVLGKCSHGYGFNAPFQRKLHNGKSIAWGPAKDKKGGHVVGVAIDMIRGEIKYGIDGCWGPPLGVAFENIQKQHVLHYPAISGWRGTSVFVNFGQVDYMYGPPGALHSFLSLV